MTTDVQNYLTAVPPERRELINEVYQTVRAHMPDGYEEAFAWGMIAWQVPLSTYPDTYNGQPLLYAALANQKRYASLYLMAPYADAALLSQLTAAYQRAGIKLDMGKSCLRFASRQGILLDAVGNCIAAMPPERFIAMAKQAHRTHS